MSTKARWEHVYEAKQSDQVSWYQEIPEISLRLIDHANIEPNT
jgi:hypothetical protein